ncbi:hypothetical protein KCU77_g711, partial [Aureobasidium melanogenum]
MPARKVAAPSELPVSTIVDWFGKQEHFPPVVKVGPQTVMNWMKAMKTSQTDNRLSKKVGEVLRSLQEKAGITKAQSMTYIQTHGESLTAPVISSAFHESRLDRKRQKRKKRQQKKAKQEAQANANADARARAKAEANDDEEVDTLFAGTFRHIQGRRRGVLRMGGLQ